MSTTNDTVRNAIMEHLTTKAQRGVMDMKVIEFFDAANLAGVNRAELWAAVNLYCKQIAANEYPKFLALACEQADKLIAKREAKAKAELELQAAAADQAEPRGPLGDN